VTLPVFWIPEANEDLLEARAWYDNIRSELGERFALAVEATVEAIAENPMQFPVVYRSRRRAGVRRFPYGIFFEVQDTGLWSSRVSTAGATQGVGKRGNKAYGWKRRQPDRPSLSKPTWQVPARRIPVGPRPAARQCSHPREAAANAEVLRRRV
jgi:hypothetical protein